MKYLLAIAVVLAGVIFPLAVKGQSVTESSLSPAPTIWSKPGFIFDGGFGFRGFRARSQPVVFPPFFGYPSNYPFSYFYPGLWPPLDVEYQQASRIAHGDVAGEVGAQEKAYLSSQVQALRNEVESLRQQQASRYLQQNAAPRRTELSPVLQPQTGAERKFPSTVFVYRDGREMEVRDYAIFGETLWVFRGQTSRKFPLADFNLAASRQVNEEHGIEFPVPGPHQH